jgi:hypothetical protein
MHDLLRFSETAYIEAQNLIPTSILGFSLRIFDMHTKKG